jgi:hypothetical protein
VAATGAACKIGFSLLFRIASESMFGPEQPVILYPIEVEPALPALGGVAVEMQDCAFPLLKRVTPTASLDEGFNGVDWALPGPHAPASSRADPRQDANRLARADRGSRAARTFFVRLDRCADSARSIPEASPARMAAAKRPALIAPGLPIANVVTGIPLGI